MIDIQNGEQLNSLLTSEKTCIVDCYADWCGPCKRVMPVFKSISEEFSDNESFEFYKLKIDQQDEDIQAFVEKVGIDFIPLFLVIKKGVVETRIENVNEIRDYISSE